MVRDREERQFFDEVYRDLGVLAVATVKPFIPSQTLRDELYATIERGREEGVSLRFRSYWARYYHDGRGPVLPQQAEFIVFFRDPTDDPRHGGDYPERRSEIRQLSPAEFEYGLMLNQIARANGAPEPMIVMRTRDFQALAVGPAEGEPFFDRPELANVYFNTLMDRLEQHLADTVLRIGSRRRRRDRVELKIRL